MSAPRFAAAYPDLVDALRVRYGERHRAYHTWAHIAALLEHFQHLPWADPLSVEIALYWHDAVYAPMSATNEADSAALMRREMEGRVAADVLDRAEAMVMATAGHAVPEAGDEGLRQDCAQFLDMDLSILGAPWTVFADYDRAIRREFAQIPDAVFLPRRRKVMAGFLVRDRLYLTDTFRDSHERQARANLERLVAELPED